MPRLSKSDKLFQLNTLAIFVIGFGLTLIGFQGNISKFNLLPILLVLIFLVSKLVNFLFVTLPSLKEEEYILLSILLVIWLLHFIQVLVPESGFDAVWYHLPVISQVLELGSITYTPELYQSINPLFSDLYFLVGFSFGSIVGTKLIAYLFATMLVFASYKLARLFLNRTFSLAVVLLISTFQVISWQSSSFYIDIPKAFFEVAALWSLLNHSIISGSMKSALLFGASLATKLFSILLLPIFVLIEVINMKERNILNVFKVFILILLIPLPYYLFAYVNTGNPFYSLVVHIEKLNEIGGDKSIVGYFISRTIQLPTLPIVLSLSRDYVTPFILLFVLPTVLKLKAVIEDKRLLTLLIFSIAQLLLWWYLPPLSTRYALSGFITLVILGVVMMLRMKQFSDKREFVLLLIVVISLFNFVPRIVVARRSLNYLFSNQTEREYLEQFYDGNVDEKLKTWYEY